MAGGYGFTAGLAGAGVRSGYYRVMPQQVTDAALLVAGVPSINKGVYHRVRFAPHDPVAWIALPDGATMMIVRDVELPRARASGRADVVHCYEDFPLTGGLSGDRGVRAAQATAECLVRNGIGRVLTDRSLSLLFADELRHRGIEVVCDRDMGVAERRRKDADEVAALRAVQAITEDAIRDACEHIGRARASDTGGLVDAAGVPLTSESVRRRLDLFLIERGCVAEDHIVAGGPQAADCHFAGAGPLRTDEPIIVDVFPRHLRSGYHGDCTRTVVHGKPSPKLVNMHGAVVASKSAALAATRAGVTGEAIHLAAVAVLQQRGYAVGFDSTGTPGGFMPHGTGHGIGLDLKEPPLLDLGGPPLLAGDAVTVEPALYADDTGGVRLEDMVIVTADGHDNLNELGEGLDWV